MPIIQISREFFLGCDPGEKGGLAVIDDSGSSIWKCKMPETAQGLLEAIQSIPVGITKVCLERIDPRPTRWMKGGVWQSSILRSTCIIYGDYLQLHMALIACGHDVVIVGPAQWQKDLGIEKKRKGEKKTQFKNRLKEFAQELFPNVKMTLAICDAYLLAEYVRRQHAQNS